MGEMDRQHRVKLVVDEWGGWYAPGTEPFAEALLGQQSTMRDAVLAGLTLDTFNRHADKVGMAAVAQLVNCLQSLFFAHEDKFCVTPTYHVFDMYRAHQGRSRCVRWCPRPRSRTRETRDGSQPGLSCSASLRERVLTLTVTNPSLDQAREVEIVLRGAARIRRLGEGCYAGGRDAHAHNSFDSPHAVDPRAETMRGGRRELTRRFPPASVTKLEIHSGIIG